MESKKFSANRTRLDTVMALLGVSANRLSGLCKYTSQSISGWQRGAHPLTARNEALEPLAAALLSVDKDGRLDELLAPWRTGGEGIHRALCIYLTGEDLPALPARAAPPQIQSSGSYITQQQVLLGARGFRKATLMMLDYVMTLPPGRQIVVCAHNGFDLFLHNVPFALQFLQKMISVVKRGTTFQLVNRRGFGMENAGHYARFWLVAHLKGILRSRYYSGDPPEEYFVASIRGYWSGVAENDPTADDGLIGTMFTDPRNIRKAEAHCDEYINKSAPASQYGFLENPQGDQENAQGWKPGPLPEWNEPDAPEPDGSFSAICRVPCIGVMTKSEFKQAAGSDTPPPLPDYLFREKAFAAGAHRIILCREDVQEGLLKERRQNEPLSAILHRRAFVTPRTLAAMLTRMLEMAAQNERFEIALVPRSAFAKLELELVCWRYSASVGWLQDGSESIFANDPITSGCFYAAIEHTWGKLHKGWKRQSLVQRTLRKWLVGKGLDVVEPDSAIVRNWDVLPRE
jgi:hypothetical protein